MLVCAKYQDGDQFPQRCAESWDWKAVRTIMSLGH